MMGFLNALHFALHCLNAKGCPAVDRSSLTSDIMIMHQMFNSGLSEIYSIVATSCNKQMSNCHAAAEQAFERAPCIRTLAPGIGMKAMGTAEKVTLDRTCTSLQMLSVA